MKTYISILRGINVGGNNRIKMDALQTLYASLDCKNVTTYVQSGNVVFQGEVKKSKEWSVRISQKIKTGFGFEVPVIVLDIAELQKVIQENPLLNNSEKEPKFLHVTFLGLKLVNIDIDVVASKKQMGEEIAFTEKAVYLYCPNGYGKTKLNNTYLEKKLQVMSTTRNWKTTNALLEIALKVAAL